MIFTLLLVGTCRVVGLFVAYYSKPDDESFLRALPRLLSMQEKLSKRSKLGKMKTSDCSVCFGSNHLCRGTYWSMIAEAFSVEKRLTDSLYHHLQ
jgi:hypothetical protein